MRPAQPSRLQLALLFFAMGAIIIFWVATSHGNVTSGQPPAPTLTRSFAGLPAGQDGQLDNGGPTAFVAVDDVAFDELTKAANANDGVGIRELVRAGRVFLAPQHTAIRVLENGVFSVRVRILEGPQKDKAGWVPAEFVKR